MDGKRKHNADHSLDTEQNEGNKNTKIDQTIEISLLEKENKEEEDDQDEGKDAHDVQYQYCVLPQRANTFQLMQQKRKVIDVERMKRGLSQGIYYIQHEFDAEKEKYKFDIQGCTSNYIVSLSGKDKQYCCDCPDFTDRDVTCKHLCFIFYKLFHMKMSTVAHPEFDIIWQHILEFDKKMKHPTHHNNIISTKPGKDTQPIASLALSAPSVQSAYPYPNNECGICCGDIEIHHKVKICEKQCKNVCHQECFSRWSKKNQNCIYCRAVLI